eukprot:CAMPEP_0174383168 /NCGR_PEP_ID=MMETSP0811_2-20130205/125048_1 /TAXON_ID=73025 ORGANISM="Eutreptiella gymnastica-like, Strain CCMP1594" /NCGR_SAMPLE_ID=MMETSP0811_2 /ASSEMBLY_ACC=CAM_ASM_000667 /LENGTH=65 /DNA_ID=CAMNT_0015536651 /DNA_START=800 /DNA_END=997 /DNA_ORIENTATION=+
MDGISHEIASQIQMLLQGIPEHTRYPSNDDPIPGFIVCTDGWMGAVGSGGQTSTGSADLKCDCVG